MAEHPLSKASKSPFIHLDMARGLASLAVLFGHLRSFVFVSYDQLRTHNIMDVALWSATSFAHQAVTIFFVLSGFFITRSILEDDRLRGFSWPIYLIKRLSRLWIVLLPCLILTLLCDRLGMFTSGMAFYSGKLFPMYVSGPAEENGGAVLNLETFIGNLFFLQNIMVTTFGSNGPLWSLAYEFWYYLMFPLLFLSVTRIRNWLCVTLNVVILIAICMFVGKYIVLSGIVWLGGALSYIVYDRKWCDGLFRARIALGFAMALFLTSLALSKVNVGTEAAKDYCIGATATLLVLVLVRQDVDNSIYRKVAHILADGSYTTYLVHFPFLALLANAVLLNHKFANSLSGYGVFVGLAIVTLMYCYLVYWLFERNTGRVRRYCVGKYKELASRSLRSV